MKKQKFNYMLSLVSAMTLASGSQAIYAQTAEPEEVIVTGFRATILNSVEAKRQADVVSDVVDASALGSLPAVSIADALGRVPGVTTVRDSGQASQLNIRGMNGDFIETTMNGREQASTSSYTESLRWMSFDQYPAELINQAAVYKSPKASHIEGGVAGTVELKTADPLKAPKEHNFNVGYRRSYNDAAKEVGADENGDRLNFSYQGKFLDETLGVALGYSHLDQPKNFQAARALADEQVGYVNADVDGVAGTESVPRALQFQAGSGKDTRDGYLATVVFKPVDNLRAQLDYFKSDFESEDLRHGVTFGGLGNTLRTTPNAATGAPANLTDPVITDGVLTGGTIAINNTNTTGKSSPWIESRTEDQTTQADSDSYGLNLAWDINDDASLTFDISHSKGNKTRKDRLASMHAYEFGTDTGDYGSYVNNGTPDDPNTPANESQTWVPDPTRLGVTGPTWQELSGQSFSFASNGVKTPSITLGSGTSLTGDNMRLSRYEEYPHEYTDTIDSVSLDFKMNVDFAIVKSFETGFRISEREFGAKRGTFLYGSRDGQFNYVDADGRWSSWCEDNMSRNPAIACVPQSVGSFAGVASVKGAPDHLAVTDLDGLASSIFGVDNYKGVQTFSRDWTFIESGDLVEKVNAIYFLANIETDISDIPVTGNVGVRVVESDVKAKGIQNVGGGNGDTITDGLGVVSNNYKYISYGPKFTDVLPSLNLNFAITEEDTVRFALAKVMARPPSGQLKGGAGSWTGGDLGANQYNVWTKGSPYLDPFRATQLDVSYEHYFEDGDAVTAAVFYKDIESLTEKVNYQAGTVDFASLGIDTPDGMVDGIFQTVQNNDKGGYIRGFELASTSTFTSLPGVFSGLGLTASYSFTESETEIGGGDLFQQKLPLPGLSKNVWSLTGFWDIGRFSTHVNARYRDDYIVLLAIPGSSTPAEGQAYTTYDAQMSYAFDNGVDLVFEVNNITDEANVTSLGNESALGEYKEFGRQYYLGVNYKF